MSGAAMQTDCGVAALRLISRGETWWHDDDNRICGDCLEAADA